MVSNICQYVNLCFHPASFPKDSRKAANTNSSSTSNVSGCYFRITGFIFSSLVFILYSEFSMVDFNLWSKKKIRLTPEQWGPNLCLTYSQLSMCAAPPRPQIVVTLDFVALQCLL